MNFKEKYRIISNDSVRFCEEFINHIENDTVRRKWEAKKNLIVSEKNNWITFIIPIDDVNIMFYHNKFVTDRTLVHIIKVGMKSEDIKKLSNILPDSLASKVSFSDNDFRFIVSLVLVLVDLIQKQMIPRISEISKQQNFKGNTVFDN